MSHLSATEIARLCAVADEIRETFEERGYRVGEAMEVDVAFGTNRSRSALKRGLIDDAIKRAAGQQGLDFAPVRGGGLEIRTFNDFTERRHRVRSGYYSADGDLVVPTSSDSALAIDESVASLRTIETWVFIVVTSDDPASTGDIVAAEVIDFVPGNPGRLVLRHTTPLIGTSTPPDRGFLPSDEDLDGFDDGEDGLGRDRDAS